MYKRYDKGNIYQIDFGNGYGYIHEVGEDCYENNFAIVYERRFSDTIQNVEKLSSETYFIGRFAGFLSRNCLGSANHPIKQTARGSEFENRIYTDNLTGEFKKTYIYVKCLGSYPIPIGIEFPQYLREDDYNFITGTYKWVVRTSCGKFIKQQKTAKGIEHVPPDSLTFGHCADWWEEGVTLETWNDEYCLRVIEKRYLKYPMDRPIKMSFEEAVATMPTKEWRKGESDKKRMEWYDGVEGVLQQFVKALSSAEKIPLKEAKKATKELCLKLNGLQNEEFLIETQDGDDLFTFISNLLRVKKVVSAIEVLDEYRDW